MRSALLLALALAAAVAFGVAVGRATAADPLPECPEWTWGWS